MSTLIGLTRKSMQRSHPPEKGSGAKAAVLVPKKHLKEEFDLSSGHSLCSGWYHRAEGGASWLERSKVTQP